MKYITPTVFGKNFTCPHCAAISQQQWWVIDWDKRTYEGYPQNALRVGTCVHCGEHTLWIGDKMCFPDTGSSPPPNSEMPPAVRALYEEAASIQSKSPRGSAALLRLAVQVLCGELGEKGKSIDEDIASLVKKGLPGVVQQSLDILRVTGNHAVHPGQIDTDDPTTVAKLYDLLNVIVEYMIALPKRVSGIYTALPANALNAIKKRDGG